MTPEPVPPAFQPARFRSAAAYYALGRVPYAPALIRRVAAAAGLGPGDDVLDLGCGPATLARLFAPLARAVVAVDPSAEMLAEARALSREPNIRFVEGSSYGLGPALGRFRLAVMGRSFHWMDRADTLRRLDGMIVPGGAVALFHDTAPDIPDNAWRRRWRDVRERFAPEAEPHRRDPAWVRHEALLLASPFGRIESFGVVERRDVDAETLVARALSMSSTSPSALGGAAAEAMAREMRAALADVREEVVHTSALVAWR